MKLKELVQADKYTLYQKTKDPIFKKPETSYGRAHFYAAEKIIFGQSIDTINTDVIWLSIALGVYPFII